MQQDSVQNSGRIQTGSRDHQETLLSQEVRSRLPQGARAVRFEYCMSFLIATVRRQSAVYITESWQERYIRGMGYNVVTLLLGPWGVPWGLIGTARSLWTNLTGGIDASAEVIERLTETQELRP